MTTIGNNIPVGYIPPPITSGPAQTGSVEETQSAGAVAQAPLQSLSMTAPAGEFAFASADAGGLDWDAIATDQLALQNTSAQMSEIMTLMIEVMSQMRQDARENALKDAQNALSKGLSAAEHMKDAALATLLTSVGSQAISLGASVYSSAKLAGTGGLEGAELRSQLDSINAKSQMIGSVGTLVNTGGSYIASLDQAQAKSDEAQAQYEQTLQQSEQSFFQEMGDTIRALMDSWKGTESATHQAYQGIYNV